MPEGVGVSLAFNSVDIDAESLAVIEVELHNIFGLMIVVEMVKLYLTST